MSMHDLPNGPLKMKAIMISKDGGKHWTITRRWYIIDMSTNEYLDEGMLGMHLATMEEADHGDVSKTLPQ